MTRESPWDEQARDEAEALYLLPAMLCPCGCGRTREEAQDRRSWKVDHFVCEPSRQLAIAQRVWSEQHENDKPDRDGGLPGDGLVWNMLPPGEE